MTDGYKSPLIFEGYSALTEQEKAGYRSLLAFWLGGLSGNTVRRGGYTSLLGFWLGGISAAIQSITPPTPEPVTVAVQERRWPGPSFTLFREGEKEPSFIRRRKEEEEIIFL